MRFLQIFSFVLFFFVSVQAPAQEKDIKGVEQVFSFNPYPDAAGRISNELLQRISRASGKLRAYTSFTMQASLETILEQQANGSLQAGFSLKYVSFTGDIIYRDFSLEKILIPNRMQMKVSILDAAGKIIYDSLLTDVRLPANGGTFISLTLPRKVQSQAWGIKASDVRFYYTEKAFERFTGWFNALDQYYAAENQLQQVWKLIDGLSYSSVESVLLDEFTLCEAEGIYNRVKYSSFHNWLELKTSDPQEVLESLDELQKIIEPLRQGFNHSVSRIDSLYYQSAKCSLEKGDIQKARQHLSQALIYNPLHIPSHLSLARLDLQAGNKASALNRMANVHATMFPSGEIKIQSLELSEQLTGLLLEDAAELTWALKHLDALATLKHVEDFCQKTAGFIPCPEELQSRLTFSHKGMYRSFLTVASRARRGHNLSFARSYINSAIEYQQKNQEYIPDALEALEQMQWLLDHHYSLGYLKLGNNNFPEAGTQFSVALDICNEFPSLTCPQGLNDIYTQLNEGSFPRVVTLLSSPAHDLLTRGINPTMPEEVRREVSEIISNGLFRAWAGNLEEARDALSQVKKLTAFYSLQSDTLIYHRLNSLVERISEKECELANREIADLLTDIKRFRELGAFGHAAAAAKRASVNSLEIDHCLLWAQELEQINDLMALNSYLSLMENALSGLQTGEGDILRSFSDYRQAELLFAGYNLKELGQEHLAFSSFISQSNDTELVNAALVYMTQWPDQHLQDITSILENLRLKGVPNSRIKQAQEATGQMLATWHQGENHIRQLLNRGGKWYLFLEEAFRHHQNN
jgi:tetratricopeptide (TPR) repeat protein